MASATCPACNCITHIGIGIHAGNSLKCPSCSSILTLTIHPLTLELQLNISKRRRDTDKPTASNPIPMAYKLKSYIRGHWGHILAISIMLCPFVLIFFFGMPTNKDELNSNNKSSLKEAADSDRRSDERQDDIWFIPSEFRVVLRDWLNRNPSFRVATENDWQVSAKAEKHLLNGARKTWGKQWKPYFAVGDFNHDGKQDFAIGLIEKKSFGNFYAVAVFNGPLSVSSNPVYLNREFGISDWLYVDSNDQLMIGVYESEAVELQPDGDTYFLHYRNVEDEAVMPSNDEPPTEDKPPIPLLEVKPDESPRPTYEKSPIQSQPTYSYTPYSPSRSAGSYLGGSSGHWVSENHDGAIIELEDGSLWMVSDVDRIDSSLWLATEDIVIRSSNNLYFPYRLINTDNHETVEAKFIGYN